MSIESLIANLPESSARFTPKRKAAILLAIDGAAITQAQAMARYSLTESELDSWRALTIRNGLAGLRVTRCQTYRALNA